MDLNCIEINSQNVTNYFRSLLSTPTYFAYLNELHRLHKSPDLYLLYCAFRKRSSKYERRALKVACRMKYGTEIRAAHDKTLSTLNVYPGEVEKNKSTPGVSMRKRASSTPMRAK